MSMQERQTSHWNGIIELTPIEVWEFYNSKGFTERQRSWIKERDGGCVFQHPEFQHECHRHGLSYKHQCRGTIHIHHIVPRAYMTSRHYDEDFINRGENGVSICAYVHMNFIHPDMGEALRNYKGDKTIIEAVFQQRKEKLRNNEIYWIPNWDVPLAVIAHRFSRRQESSYPIKKTHTLSVLRT